MLQCHHLAKDSHNMAGYVLLPVLSLIALIAILTYMASRSISVDSTIYKTEQDKDRAFYAARAGVEHSLWKIKQNNSCYGYANASLPRTQLGSDNNTHYETTISPSQGANVTITTTAEIKIPSTPAKTISKTFTATQAISITVPLLLQPNSQDGNDTSLLNDKATENLGADKNLYISNEKNEDYRALLKFPISSVQTWISIVSASMSLFLESAKKITGTSIQIHNITRTWLEGTRTYNKDEKKAPTPDGANWNTYDSSRAWSNPGGDFDPIAEDSQAITNKKNTWYDWDVTQIVVDWSSQTPNNGVILQVGAGTLDTGLFSSSDSTTSANWPKLTINYKCKCQSSCSADFVPTANVSEFSTAGFGLSNIWGITYLPDCPPLYSNGSYVPQGGAWLLSDDGNNNFIMTDMAGTQLSSMTQPSGNGKGVTYVNSGNWAGSLAQTDSVNAMVYFIGLDGSSLGSFATKKFTSNPVGITFIESPTNTTFKDHLIISSDQDKNGILTAALYIVDQTGVLKATIDVSAISPAPWGIAHLPGTDKIMVVDKNSSVSIIDFTGNIYSTYNAALAPIGATLPQGTAINPTTCDQLIVDRNTQRVITLH